MRVLLIYNASDTKCGFANFGWQTATALRRAGCAVTVWDGGYPVVHARSERQEPDFFPADVETYDVVHVIWNALTLNHYSGARWPVHPVISWWDGGPSDASCPFQDTMQVRWSDYPREGYEYLWYPVPDWVDDLPTPAPRFTVGASSVRGDGVPLLQQICQKRGWAMNLPDGVWRAHDDEVRRLARSMVNVCWYHTPPLWHNRASAPSMMLASGRPLLINGDPLVAHLVGRADVYYQQLNVPDPPADAQILEDTLCWLSRQPLLHAPIQTAADLSWTVAAQRMLQIWQEAP